MHRIYFIAILFFLFSCQNKSANDDQSDTGNPENNPTPSDQLVEAKNEESSNGEINNKNQKSAGSSHEQNIMAFPDLKVVSPAGFDNAYVFYDSEHSQLINEKDTARDAEPTVSVIKTKLDVKEKDIYTITFSPGLSNDPLFIVKKGKKEIGNFNANELIIPGNGTVYTSSRTNNLFDQRRKYQLKDGKIQEVKQPFLYVGLQTKTNAAIQLYSSNDFKQVLASIPKDTDIEVLVSSGKNYLIRTPFGLTGWWKNTSGKDTPIEALKFEGD
jgi:hypothetical protein